MKDDVECGSCGLNFSLGGYSAALKKRNLVALEARDSETKILEKRKAQWTSATQVSMADGAI